MRNPLNGPRVVLGVCGSIAAYKAAAVASKLVQQGARVDVIMTPNATKFVAPLTFRSLTNRPVLVDMFDVETEVAEEHVDLARSADVVIVVPATATLLGRLAHGLADEMVSLTILATKAPVILVPAMDGQMWENPAVAANVGMLRSRGFSFVGPVEGRLASGRLGSGRMAEPADVVDAAKELLGRQRGDLAGRRIVVSAGGTREPIDPVRYVGNHSSGKMGYSIAEAARDRGAEVTLVTTVAYLAAPYGVNRIDVGTAHEMLEGLRAACSNADALIMAAAVADFRPRGAAEHKIKRREVGSDFSVPLEENPDVVAALRDLPMVRVGFSAESRDLLANARAKLEPKGLAFIVANDVSAEGSGFGTDTNAVSFLYPDGHVDELPTLPKYEVAHELLDRLLPLLAPRR